MRGLYQKNRVSAPLQLHTRNSLRISTPFFFEFFGVLSHFLANLLDFPQNPSNLEE